MDRAGHRPGSTRESFAGEEMLERLQPVEVPIAFDIGIGGAQERFQARRSRIEGAELHAQRCELEVAQHARAVVREDEPLPLDDRGIDPHLPHRFQVERPGEVRAAFEADPIDPDLPHRRGIGVLQPDRPQVVVPVRCVVVGAFLAERHRGEAFDPGQPLELLGGDLILGDAAPQRERHAVGMNPCGVEELARQVGQRDRRRHPVEVQLPLHLTVLRGEDQTPHVHGPGPHRPCPAIADVDGGRLPVEHRAKDRRQEEDLRGDDPHRPEGQGRAEYPAEQTEDGAAARDVHSSN